MSQCMGMVDVLFRVIGKEVPSDHGYALFSAVSRILETEEDRWLHNNPSIGLHTIRGTPCGDGKRLLNEKARFGLRVPYSADGSRSFLPRVLKLAGRKLFLDGCNVRVGVSETRALRPAAALYCHIVTTKNGDDPRRFDDEIARQVAALGIRGEFLRVPGNAGGADDRDPSRRIVRVKDKRIVGYSMLATALTAEESIRLQEHGLGGRRRMGCGVFVPFKAAGRQSARL